MKIKKVKFIGLALFVYAANLAVLAQDAPPPTPPAVRSKRIGMIPPAAVRAGVDEGATSERSMAVDPKANIKICVIEGNLKINGWARPEVRVFVRNGSRVGIDVLEKDATSSLPVWLLVSKHGGPAVGREHPSECIRGEEIEIDVPMNSSISVSGKATETVIDSVRKASVKNVEGSIWLRNISGGIMAATYQGDVTVENSGGAISLESATGNIVGYEVRPGDIGDLFKVKTNSGAISLQRLEHRQIEANSITGSVAFDGKFMPGGIYSFKTSNGAVRLTIPAASSATIAASYGFGRFNSELPLKYTSDNVSDTGKSLAATIGAGDARVNITTTSGSISIKKQP